MFIWWGFTDVETVSQYYLDTYEHVVQLLNNCFSLEWINKSDSPHMKCAICFCQQVSACIYLYTILIQEVIIQITELGYCRYNTSEYY